MAPALVRRRSEPSGKAVRSWRNRSGLSDEAWRALKRNHAALLAAAGFERSLLDRLCLDDDPPLACKEGRVQEALGRIGEVA